MQNSLLVFHGRPTDAEPFVLLLTSPDIVVDGDNLYAWVVSNAFCSLSSSTHRFDLLDTALSCDNL